MNMPGASWRSQRADSSPRTLFSLAESLDCPVNSRRCTLFGTSDADRGIPASAHSVVGQPEARLARVNNNNGTDFQSR